MKKGAPSSLKRGFDELLHPADHDGVEPRVEDLDEVAAPRPARRQGLPIRLLGGEGLVAGTAVHEEVSAEFRCGQRVLYDIMIDVDWIIWMGSSPWQNPVGSLS